MIFIQELKNNLNYSLNFVGRPFYNFSKVFSFYVISFAIILALYFSIEYFINFISNNTNISSIDILFRGLELSFSVNFSAIFFLSYLMFLNKENELSEFDVSKALQSIDYKSIIIVAFVILLFYIASRTTKHIEMSESTNALESILSLFGKSTVASTIELWIGVIFDFGKYIIPPIGFVYFLQHSYTKKVSLKFIKEKRTAIFSSVLIYVVLTVFATTIFDITQFSFFSICKYFEFYSYLTILVSLIFYCVIWSFVITLCAATLYYPWQTKLQSKQQLKDELLDESFSNEL